MMTYDALGVHLVSPNMLEVLNRLYQHHQAFIRPKYIINRTPTATKLHKDLQQVRLTFGFI